MTAPSSTPTLDELELLSWRGMLEVHAALTQTLDAEMRAQHGLTLSAYEVLMFLADAPGGKMRMSEIADRVLLSRSAVTRLVDRLEALGLVERCAAPEDGRGAFAQITDAGRERFGPARRTHLDGVRRRFLDHLSAGDQRALADAWARIRAAEHI
jgi:DNA-binding MarR family transcriptional regulator